MNVVDANWTAGHNGFVEGEIVVAGPTPLFGFLDQHLANRVHVHVLQPLSKLFGIADKPILGLVLPA